jgi:8-oxo-dGTP pyrophosphatase MutT (NUDIX family)
VIITMRSDGSSRYLLQLNRHLFGYNWVGGHIDADELPLDSARREAQEELFSDELEKRWAIPWSLLQSILPSEDEIGTFQSSISPVTSMPYPLMFPFYSYRYSRERIAECYFHVAEVSAVRTPKLVEYLKCLHNQYVDFLDGRLPLCTLANRAGLETEAARNPKNPFLAPVLTAGLLQ